MVHVQGRRNLWLVGIAGRRYGRVHGRVRRVRRGRCSRFNAGRFEAARIRARKRQYRHGKGDDERQTASKQTHHGVSDTAYIRSAAPSVKSVWS